MFDEMKGDHLEEGPEAVNEDLPDEFPPVKEELESGSPEDQAAGKEEGAEGPDEGSPFAIPEKLEGKSSEELAKIIADNDRMISKQGERLSNLEEENSSLAEVMKKFVGDEEEEPDIEEIAREKGLGAALDVFGERLLNSLDEKLKKAQEETSILSREAKDLLSMRESVGKEKMDRLMPVMALMLEKNPGWRGVPNYLKHLLNEAASEMGMEDAEVREGDISIPAPFPRASRSAERLKEGSVRLTARELEVLDNYGVKVEDYIRYRKSGSPDESRRKAGI